MGHTLRVVLDTNVLLSRIAYPGSLLGKKILAAWRHGLVGVLLQHFILDELRRVLPRLASRRGLTLPQMNDLADVLAILAERIEPSDGQDAALSDANDPPVLGTLLTARAREEVSYRITGDKDLLPLAERYPIVTPVAFLAMYVGWVGDSQPSLTSSENFPGSPALTAADLQVSTPRVGFVLGCRQSGSAVWRFHRCLAFEDFVSESGFSPWGATGWTPPSDNRRIATASGKAPYNTTMFYHPTIVARTAARLSFVACGAVAGRKLMGSAGLRQPAADS